MNPVVLALLDALDWIFQKADDLTDWLDSLIDRSEMRRRAREDS